MNSWWRFLTIVLFLIGFFVTGLSGTSTTMTFVWPGYFLIGLAGALSIASLFSKTHFRVPYITFAAVFALLCYFLIRSAGSPVRYFAREDASLLIVCFVVYGVFLSLFQEGRWRNALLWSIVSLVIINLAMAMGQRLINPSLWLLPGYERTFADRIGGIFNHPDHFAAFLAAAIPLMLAVAAFSKKALYPRVFLATLCGLCYAAIIASGSLSGFIAATAGGGFVLLLGLIIVWPNLAPIAKRGVLAIFALSVISFSLIYVIKQDGIAYRFENQVLKRGGEMDLPLMWESAGKQFSQSPLIGTGSRTHYYYSRLFRSDQLADSSSEAEFAHNEYLQTLADYGLAGLSLLLIALLLHAFRGLRFVFAYRGFRPLTGLPIPQSDHLGLAMGSLGSIFSIALLSMGDFIMHLPIFAVLATVLLAFLACPDPMAQANKQPRKMPLIPGGGTLFATRAAAFGSGVALLVFGSIFSQSEWHYEMARLAFEGDPHGYKQFSHLQKARKLDPMNPFVFSLAGHAHAAAIQAGMEEPVRTEALKKSDEYFQIARELYPQDVHAAVGHSAVLDALGKHDLALKRIENAQEWAPLYGTLMMSKAEHYLRTGNVDLAQQTYAEAKKAAAFRDSDSAERGMELANEWQNADIPANLAEGNQESATKTPAEATIKEVEVSASADMKRREAEKEKVPSP